MSHPVVHSKYPILGGVIFSALANLGSEDFLKTGIMAVFGTFVSYLASLLFKRLYAWANSRSNSKKGK
ncbi:hypothetical protein V8G61_04735 [Gaetbulibacter sp. M240]|uniref:hypothetical protein n=1 Tax=Gaetbulibacter sp. M240 TaxID=3126511 RepID=UPI00374E9AF2